MKLHITLLGLLLGLADAIPINFPNFPPSALNLSLIPSPTTFNVSSASGFHIDFPTPTTGCVEEAVPGHWHCDYSWPTMEQFFYWMDPVNGGGVTAERVPLFYYGWGNSRMTRIAIGWGKAYLHSLFAAPTECYEYETAMSLTAGSQTIITGQEIDSLVDGWYFPSPHPLHAI